MNIQDIADYLDKVGLQFMATIGLDGKPKVRPMQYMVLHDDKLWFCTNSQKQLYAELQANPEIELCGARLHDDEMQTPWIRLSARVVFEDSPEVRHQVMQKSIIVRTLYQDYQDNPIFRLFYLTDVHGSVNNLGHVKGLADRAGFAPVITF